MWLITEFILFKGIPLQPLSAAVRFAMLCSHGHCSTHLNSSLFVTQPASTTVLHSHIQNCQWIGLCCVSAAHLDFKGYP